MRLSAADLYVAVLVAATVLYATVALTPHLNPVDEPGLPRWSEIAPHLSATPQRARVLGYERAAFGPGWANEGACDAREEVLRRHFPAAGEQCAVAGEAVDVYTGETVTPGEVEIDHVFPLATAWDLGAHAWDTRRRAAFANDPVNLVPTAAAVNREKSDQLPGAWVPPDPSARCWYARRVAYVAAAYSLPLPDDDVAAMRSACRVGEWLDLY